MLSADHNRTSPPEVRVPLIVLSSLDDAHSGSLYAHVPARCAQYPPTLHTSQSHSEKPVSQKWAWRINLNTVLARTEDDSDYSVSFDTWDALCAWCCHLLSVSRTTGNIIRKLCPVLVNQVLIRCGGGRFRPGYSSNAYWPQLNLLKTPIRHISDSCSF